jgi:archaellum component FlaG (FlaF/FlaG flagellin family)
MNRRIRGAATVGLVWVIVLVVLLLIAGSAAYVFASDKTDVERKLRDSETAVATEKKKYTDAASKVARLSEIVGFRNEDDKASESRADEAKGRVAALQDANSAWLGKDASTLARVLDAYEAKVADLNKEIAEAKQQHTAAEASRSATERSLREVTTAKDEDKAKITKELQDERDRNSAQESADKSRIEELNGRLTAADAKAKGEKEELETKLVQLQDEVKKRDGRIAELAKRVETIRLPEEPDGSVVAVSTADTCYIDLGSKQLLRRGTRFKVFTYGKNGAMREKGMVEVSSVQDAMAECTVVDVKDRLDPISRGDKISAPNYDPEMPREFVLTGRFPSGYSRAMVADRLRALGAKVADKVGPTTDFLVLGEAETVTAAAEGEEAGGDGGAETGDMQLAQLYRVQILPVREILEFLKYE